MVRLSEYFPSSVMQLNVLYFMQLNVSERQPKLRIYILVLDGLKVLMKDDATSTNHVQYIL